MKRPGEKSQIRSIPIVITLTIVFFLRLLFLLRLDVFPDEAYYWGWSRFLSPGYFDHPPMIAWLVHLTTSLLGDTYWGIKAVPLLVGSAFSVVAAVLAARFVTSTAAVILFLLLVNTNLLYAAGGLLLTPDIACIFFWALGMLLGYQAVFERKTAAWPLLGVVVGLGLLSKYVFVLFIGSFVLFLIFVKEHRKLLLTWKPWSAFFIAILFFSPNVLWNAQHQWTSYLFQFGHGFRSEHSWPRINLFFEYLAGQIGLFSPLLFFVLVFAIIHFYRFDRKEKFLFLLMFLSLPLFFFAWSSLSARVEANWPAAAYFSGLLLVICYWERLGKKSGVRRFTVFAMGFSITITTLVVAHAVLPFLPISARIDRTYDSRGWTEFARQVDKIREQHDPLGKMPLCANSYQLTSLLAFHCTDQPRTWALNFNSRTNHYAFLQERMSVVDDTLLFVSAIADGEMPRSVLHYFDSQKMLAPVQRVLTNTIADSFAVYQVTLSALGKKTLIDEAGY
ncbi:phospholipid carrier-dependent glycosyltransferase [candidate division KSB1 bacterium]|nr:glycosyltransferase family 39 protein [candidate division KSB1 bacterium]RQW06877.1 MAG: phospholipid carrier-dependent glycosyltransferase [candidate division KSB1 bacterium]